MAITVTNLGPFDQGSLVEIDFSFVDTGTSAAVDPSPLIATVYAVTTATSTDYTYGTDAAWTRHATGSYTLAIDTSSTGGRWKVRVKTPSGNTYQFSEQIAFTVTDDSL